MLSEPQHLGKWAFLAGVIISVMVGILTGVSQLDNPDAGQSVVLVILLIFLGLVVGLLNVTARETTSFLLASVALVFVTNFGAGPLYDVEAVVGTFLLSIMQAISMFVVPATIVVAIKAIVSLAHD